MKRQSGEESHSAQQRLVGRLGVLVLLGAGFHLLAMWPALDDTGFGPLALVALFLFGIVYLAWVVLRTRDMVWHPASLHPTDAWLCRNSGPLSAGLAFGLLLFAITTIAVAEAAGRNPIFLRSDAVLAILYIFFEIGFVFAMACFYAPPELKPARPVLMWRLFCLILSVIYGAYVLAVPLGRLGSLLEG